MAFLQIRVSDDLAQSFSDACALGRASSKSEIVRAYLVEPYAEFAAAEGRQPHSLEEFARWIADRADMIEAAEAARAKKP